MDIGKNLYKPLIIIQSYKITKLQKNIVCPKLFGPAICIEKKCERGYVFVL